MPQGNDQEAIKEFQTQYGEHQNAEQLRVTHQNALNREVAAASLRPVDEEATKELDLADITPSQGGTVLSAAVRGAKILYVAEDETGRSYKDVQDYEG